MKELFSKEQFCGLIFVLNLCGDVNRWTSVKGAAEIILFTSATNEKL